MHTHDLPMQVLVLLDLPEGLERTSELLRLLGSLEGGSREKIDGGTGQKKIG
jgi:hypothetical protein